MGENKKMGVVWMHGLITIGLILFLPILGIFYPLGVLAYYGGRSMVRWHQTGNAQKLAVSFLIVLFFPITLPYMALRSLWRSQRDAHAANEIRREHQERLESQERQAGLQKSAQRRRSEARARCELLYSLHAREIVDRFPKSMFDAFLQTYMGDADEPEDVERRGRELQKMIEEHRKTAKPEKRPRSIQDLAEWYLREKNRINALPLDEELKQEHMAALDMRYAELTQEVLASMEP